MSVAVGWQLGVGPLNTDPVQTPNVGDVLVSQYCSTAGTSTVALNDLFWTPIFLPVNMTLSAISINIATGGAAGAVVRLGLWAPDNNLRPGTLILDAGTVPATATGVQSASINLPWNAGLVFAGAVSQVALCQWTGYTRHFGPGTVPGTLASIVNPDGSYLKQAGVSGALPSPAVPAFTFPNVTGNKPIIGLTRSA